METQKQNVQAFIKTYQIIFFALLAGPIMFGLVAFYLQNTGNMPSEPTLEASLLYAVPALAMAGAAGSIFIFKRILAGAKKKPTFGTKIRAYGSANIVRMALLEGPTMFGIVAYLLTGNLLFIGIAVALLAFCATLKPSPRCA